MKLQTTAPLILSREDRKMEAYHVVERFVSINGEARRAGELACFIRFAGCNLSCSYCDTKWASAPGVSYEEMTAEEIYAYIKETGISNVTLTGGEPLLQEGIEALLKRLSQDPVLHIEVETNGSILLRPFLGISPRISYTVDYKCPGSGMENFMQLANFPLLRDNDTVKFVVSSGEDLVKMKEITERYHLTERLQVYVSAVFGKIQPDEIVAYMIEEQLNKVRLQLQMHKYIWEPDRKGV
jgi:7-carboxy-7-deazaguanine synthase